MVRPTGTPGRDSRRSLELFIEGIDLLESRGCSRVALLGRSRGAEAVLLVAVHDKRPRAVFALSPSSVAWAGTGLERRPSWTFGGNGIPFVPYDLAWWEQPREGLIEYREYHERSLRADPQVTARAHIQVERSRYWWQERQTRCGRPTHLHARSRSGSVTTRGRVRS